MSLSPPKLQNSPRLSNLPLKGTSHPDSPELEQTTSQKLTEIELLPELFSLLQSVENGEIKGQDFDNHAGSIRLKLSNLRSYLQEVDGICETVEERQKKIEQLKDCNERRASFLQDFKNRVTADLEKMDNR